VLLLLFEAFDAPKAPLHLRVDAVRVPSTALNDGNTWSVVPAADELAALGRQHKKHTGTESSREHTLSESEPDAATDGEQKELDLMNEDNRIRPLQPAETEKLVAAGKKLVRWLHASDEDARKALEVDGSMAPHTTLASSSTKADALEANGWVLDESEDLLEKDIFKTRLLIRKALISLSLSTNPDDYSLIEHGHDEDTVQDGIEKTGTYAYMLVETPMSPCCYFADYVNLRHPAPTLWVSIVLSTG
jgi:hypothetical protein